MNIVARPLVLLVVVLALVAAIWLGIVGGDAAPSPAPAPPAPATIPAPPASPASSASSVDGAPPRDSVAPAPASAPIPPPAVAERDVVGTTPAVRADLNPNLRSVAEAARDGTHPERLTALLAPAPFDAQRFAADPQAYLDVVEPGRVFQSAAPGEHVPELELVGDAIATIPQGASTRLRVRGVPLGPVTFTSFACGAFANHLTSITVRADDAGVAEAIFTAPPGTLNDVNILAGSPLSSGQVNFCVTVTPAITALP